MCSILEAQREHCELLGRRELSGLRIAATGAQSPRTNSEEQGCPDPGADSPSGRRDPRRDHEGDGLVDAQRPAGSSRTRGRSARSSPRKTLEPNGPIASPSSPSLNANNNAATGSNAGAASLLDGPSSRETNTDLNVPRPRSAYVSRCWRTAGLWAFRGRRYLASAPA